VFTFLDDLPEAERPPLYDIQEFGTPQPMEANPWGSK
jgi:hypothetical protein